MNEYDTETLTIEGVSVVVRYYYDESGDDPWRHYDMHGLISKWTSRDKRPGERVLCQDRNSKLYYDWQAACKLARKEGWNTQPYDAPNKINRAVQADFDYLKAWCDNDWCYVGVSVAVGNTEDTVWGVETWKDNHKEYAKVLAQELVRSIRKEKQEVAYWHERDVTTMEATQ